MQKRNLKNYDLDTFYPTLTNKTFKDKINIRLTNLLNSNMDKIRHMLPKKYNKIEFNRMKNIVGNILAFAGTGQSTTYNFSKNNKKGFEHSRLFSISDSLQGVSKILKNVMIDQDNCMDIDMINCHPVILNQVAELLKLSTPILNNYISNRDSLLLELENKYNLTHDDAKNVPLAIINGGIRSKLYPEITWLNQFEKEIINIYTALSLTQIGKRIDSHVKKVNKTKNGKLIRSDGTNLNLFGTTINLLLCKIENEILTQTVLFFQSKGIEVYTLCFDGLIVSKNNIILKELEDYIYNNLGLTMKFAVKSFKHLVSDKIINFLNNIIPEEDEERKEIDFTNPGITAIQACMGYGKTTQLIDHLKSDTTSSILTIVPRCTLGVEFNGSYGPLKFCHYQTPGAFEEKRLICQIDSINKIRDKYDIIILDEIETNFNHIVSFDGMTQKATILHTLKVLIEHSKQTFIMDGTLENETKDIFKKEWPDKLFTDLTYNYKPFKDRTCNFIVGDRQIQQRHCNYVIKHLKEGMKVACPVYSLDYLKDLKNSVEKLLPDCKILQVSSEHQFKSVDEFINYDLVIYTSTLLCGNNFNEKYFDKVIPCISNVHSSAKLYSQQILRIRQFDPLVIFIQMNKFKMSDLVSEDQILTRWRYEYEDRNKKGILYDFALDKFQEDFYFNIFLKQTIEIENAPSLLLKDLYQILIRHGFNISGEQIVESSINESLLVKYNKTEDYIKIIESSTINSHILDNYTYSPHEYSKYVIEKTFDNIELVNNESMIKFVEAVHDKIPNHNNFMILKEYNIDDTIYLHNKFEIDKLSEEKIFIPKSKVALKDSFLNKKALEFIKKYSVCLNMEFKIDNEEFIEWYNQRDDLHRKIVPQIKSKFQVPKTINTLLKIYGLRLTSKQIRVKGGQKRIKVDGERKTIQDERITMNFITTLIDYKSLDVIKLEDLTCYNKYNYDVFLSNKSFDELNIKT